MTPFRPKLPPHPGSRVRALVELFGLTITAAAEALQISRAPFSNMLNGKSRLTEEQAIRLEQVFGYSAQEWMLMQGAYDLAIVRQKPRPKLRRLPKPRKPTP